MKNFNKPSIVLIKLNFFLFLLKLCLFQMEETNAFKRVKYPITRKQLCEVYRVSHPTLQIWLEEIVGIRHRRTFTPNEVALIRKRLSDDFCLV